MTVLIYDTLQDWLDRKVHLKNIDVGPDGDIFSGQLQITGDRWKHKRIGYAFAPGSTVLTNVEQSAIEAPNADANASDTSITIKCTKGFNDDDYVLLKDALHQEVAMIDTITNDNAINLTQAIANSYTMSNNFMVYTLPPIDLVKTSDFVEGDYVAISKNNDEEPSVYKILNFTDCTNGLELHGVVSGDEKTTIYVERLADSISKDDKALIVNTSTKWTRDSKNPVMGLQTEYPYDWAGNDVESAVIADSVDIYEKDDNEEWNKPGLFFTGNRERDSSQIGLALSPEEKDYYNWSQFLGNENPKRLNPMIRHSYEMDNFNSYADTAAMNKLWNSETSGLTVTLDTTSAVVGVTCMKVEYTNRGEVWGLLPVPVNFEVRSGYANGATFNKFQFKIKGHADNTQGSVIVKLLAADGTSVTSTFSNVLQLETATAEIFDFSAFAGRKYIRAVIFDIYPNSATSGTDVLYIDNVQPFMPPRWDEIVSDPALLLGDQEEAPGTMAMYYTARERPRTDLTASASTAGATNLSIAVTSTSDFLANDIVVLYDYDHYEMAKVRSVTNATNMVVEHHAYAEDNTATFEYDYDVDKMAMVANNTYKVTKIGGAYTIDEKQDTSNWVKWITDDNPRVVLDVGAAGEWDSLAVKQPSVKYIGNRVYMAYVGCSTGEYPNIGFAKSSNFTTFAKLDGNPFLEEGAGGKFDDEGCLDPDLNVWMPNVFLNYTGYDGTNKRIGSAVQSNSFHNAYRKFHVSMLVYPCASLGNVPSDGSVLFDMGNFWIEVSERNYLKAHAYVNGQWYNTDPTPEQDMGIGFGNCLVHDHWNLVIAQFTGDKLGMHRVSLMPRIPGGGGQGGGGDFFSCSPWMMTNDVAPYATEVTLTRQYDWVDGVTDYGGVGQDIMFWGKGVAGSTDYQHINSFQVGRVVSVVDNHDDTYTCQLANPIGEWGFSSSKQFNGSTNHGVMLAQGHNKSMNWFTDANYMDENINTSKRMVVMYPSADTNHIFDFIAGNLDELPDSIDMEATVSSEGERVLDQRLALPPMIGNGYGISLQKQDKKKGWDKGYIGHVDIGLDILDRKPQTLYNDAGNIIGYTGGRLDLYLQMLKGSFDRNPKPLWHKFLLDDGALPTMHQSLGYWDLNGNWDGTKFTDDSGHHNDLYLSGSATTLADGYLGRTIAINNATEDSAECQLFTNDFTKLNSGDAQFDNGVAGWDNDNVSAPCLFKGKEFYTLAYAGEGRVSPVTTGEIIGDIFECSTNPVGITLSGSFYIYPDNLVIVYAAWEKKTIWYEAWRTSTAGTQTMPETFIAMPGSTSDFYYNVRWKIALYRDVSGDLMSPIVNRFTVEYTDPGQAPSDEFLAEQNALNTTPDYRVQLVPSTGARINEKIDLTDKIVSIGDLTGEVPVKPDELGKIVTGDVTFKVSNVDKYFSELDSTSIFYNRNYLDDEIRVFSGFVMDHGTEYCLSGRYLVERVEISNTGEAQIYCRSLLREAIDTMVGTPSNNEPNPLIYQGQWKVKDIMEDLLITYANIDTGDIFIEDYDRYFSNVTIEDKSVANVLSMLAQACDGVIYTNHQGDIIFKTWDNLTAHSATTGVTLSIDSNTANVKYTGQRRDRLVKKAIVKGSDFVQGEATSLSLTYGKTVSISNEFIQKDSWANTIATNIINRYNTGQSEMTIDSAYLPSLKLLDTVKVTESIIGLAGATYLVNSISKNITDFTETYNLTKNLAKG